MICAVGAAVEIRFKATNAGQSLWLPSGTTPGAVNVGLIATKEDGTSFQFRSNLSVVPISPMTQINAIAYINGLERGVYDVELDLVSEHVVWFRNIGNRELHVKVEVT